jgi:hypothetical protein
MTFSLLQKKKSSKVMRNNERLRLLWLFLFIVNTHKLFKTLVTLSFEACLRFYTERKFSGVTDFEGASSAKEIIRLENNSITNNAATQNKTQSAQAVNPHIMLNMQN